MSTNSFLKEILIKSTKDAENFVDTLEKAENNFGKNVNINCEVKHIKDKEQIKEIFDDKKCCQCNSTKNLVKLKCGKYGCIDCLNEIANEQKEMKEYIEDYLIENFQISNPNTRANILKSIATQILMENGLLSENVENEIIELAKEMMSFE